MERVRPLAALAAAACLSACATSRPIQGPSGGAAYFVKCGSALIDKCYEEAAKVCPTGYTLADNRSSPNSVIVPNGSMLMAVRGPNTMLVECKS